MPKVSGVGAAFSPLNSRGVAGVRSAASTPRTMTDTLALRRTRLEQERFNAERADAEAERARRSMLDNLERERYTADQAQRQSEFDLMRRKTEQDLSLRERQAAANDRLLQLAAGDASPLPVPKPGTANPAQLGILTTGAPAAGAGGAAPASNTPAQTMVQDRAAQRSAGMLKRLEGEMIDRGTLNSDVHSNLIGDVLGDQAGDLLAADVEMQAPLQERAWDVEDRNYETGQRELERAEDRRRSLLNLLAGLRY